MSTSRDGVRKWTWLLPVLVTLLLYVRTAAPSVATLFDDSLEFQVVIPLLGVPHPPGYPLYTLVGKLWTVVFPWRDAAFRLNVLSALFAALMWIPLAWLLCRSTRSCWGGMVAAGVFILSPTLWAQSTIAEVYTLHLLLMAGVLYVGYRLLSDEPARWSVVGAFLFGLGLAHHRMIVLLLPPWLYWLWYRREAFPRTWRIWGRMLLAGLLPLLLYAYIPLIGARVGSLDGTYVNTWTGFWNWVLARAYRVFLTGNPFHVHRTWRDYVQLLGQEVGWPALGVVLLGLYYGARKGGAFVWGLWIGLVLHILFVVHYKVMDIQVFLLPVTLLLLFALAWGVRSLQDWGRQWPRWARTALMVGVALALFLLPLRDAWGAWEVRDRSDDWEVYDWGADIMAQPMPEGSAIVGILGETTLVRYFRDVLGIRRDVVTVPADGEAERLEAVAHGLAQGQTVFITRPLPGAPERYALDALGPLVQVSPKGADGRPQPTHPLSHPMIPSIALAGYDVQRLARHNGQLVRVTLYWDTLRRPREEYKISARLVREDGTVLRSVDDVPVHNTYPTPYWSPGERVVDVYDLPWAAGGTHVLIVLYRARDVQEVARVEFPLP